MAGAGLAKLLDDIRSRTTFPRQEGDLEISQAGRHIEAYFFS
jgi:hypothetical protein